jgi:hypothetical protein
MSELRASHTATLLPSGLVLIAGGRHSDADPSAILASAQLFDLASGTFIATGSMTVTRKYHTATSLPSGRVLVAGGVDSTGNSVASAELYE